MTPDKTPKELVEWADKIDNRMGPLSGRDSDNLALFLRMASHKILCGMPDYDAGFEQGHDAGFEAGRREMRLELYPAMNEICDVLSILSPKSADAQKLIARIHKMFEEPAQ